MVLNLAARPSDPFRDFCQWDYTPARPAAPGDLRQAALLAAVLAQQPKADRLMNLMRRIQDFWGRFNTVWGLKSTNAGPELELYFYDYARTDRRIRLNDFVKAFPDLFAQDFSLPEEIPFFMASVEVPLAAARTIAEIDLYTDGTGGTMSAGLCQVWNGQSLRLKNHYRFYKSPQDAVAILSDLANGVRTRALHSLPRFLHPGTWTEQIYVIAEKQETDSIYLSRIGVDQSLELARLAGLHSEILSTLQCLRDGLARYLFDIGIDYTVTSGGAPDIRKVGIYGLL